MVTFKIVEEYAKINNGKTIPHWRLVEYILEATNVRRDTAEDYISTLKSGVRIEGNLFKIKL